MLCERRRAMRGASAQGSWVQDDCCSLTPTSPCTLRSTDSAARSWAFDSGDSASSGGGPTGLRGEPRGENLFSGRRGGGRGERFSRPPLAPSSSAVWLSNCPTSALNCSRRLRFSSTRDANSDASSASAPETRSTSFASGAIAVDMRELASEQGASWQAWRSASNPISSSRTELIEMSSDDDDLYGDLDAAAPGSFALSELTHERDALREENEEMRAKMAAIEAEVRAGGCERERERERWGDGCKREDQLFTMMRPRLPSRVRAVPTPNAPPLIVAVNPNHLAVPLALLAPCSSHPCSHPTPSTLVPLCPPSPPSASSAKNERLKTTCKNLEKNISCLFKTAKLEIDRKDAKLDRLSGP